MNALAQIANKGGGFRLVPTIASPRRRHGFHLGLASPCAPPRDLPERVGRNPMTGADATISPRKVLTFKASPMLAARVNGETINDEKE